MRGLSPSSFSMTVACLRPSITPGCRVHRQCPPTDSTSLDYHVSLVEDCCEATEFTTGQDAVLAHVRCGPRTLRELADCEHVQAPSMTRIVKALTEHGLVSRLPHPNDGRRIQVLITSVGEAALAELRSQRTAWLDRRVTGLSEGDRFRKAKGSWG